VFTLAILASFFSADLALAETKICNFPVIRALVTDDCNRDPASCEFKRDDGKKLTAEQKEVEKKLKEKLGRTETGNFEASVNVMFSRGQAIVFYDNYVDPKKSKGSHLAIYDEKGENLLESFDLSKFRNFKRKEFYRTYINADLSEDKRHVTLTASHGPAGLPVAYHLDRKTSRTRMMKGHALIHPDIGDGFFIEEGGRDYKFYRYSTMRAETLPKNVKEGFTHLWPKQGLATNNGATLDLKTGRILSRAPLYPTAAGLILSVDESRLGETPLVKTHHKVQVVNACEKVKSVNQQFRAGMQFDKQACRFTPEGETSEWMNRIVEKLSAGTLRPDELESWQVLMHSDFPKRFSREYEVMLKVIGETYPHYAGNGQGALVFLDKNGNESYSRDSIETKEATEERLKRKDIHCIEKDRLTAMLPNLPYAEKPVNTPPENPGDESTGTAE